MAAGFKKATVQSGKVASTQTDMPAYVDLSRLGITTLAEAESVRVYADSAKTTEWCREVVSKTELHVKIPSLTTTVDIYVDWDGVRADYSVSATYGRNNVWSDYRAVYHLNDENDSTSNTYDLTQTTSGGVTFASGKVGSAASSPGVFPSNKALRRTSFAMMSDSEYAASWRITLWLRKDDTGFTWWYIMMLRGSGTYYQLWCQASDSNINFLGGAGTGPSMSALTVSQWYKIDIVADGTNLNIYRDGSFVTSGSVYKSPSSAYQDAYGILGYVENSFVQSGQLSMDEHRIVIGSGQSSAEWITTEYNNQNDEATFWGTWADVGGAAAVNARRLFLMMV